MISGKTIFIAALDWGQGHATRCVPLIHQLKTNNKLFIGTTPLTEQIFEEEFPELEKIKIPAYNISYSKYFPLWMKLFFQSLKFLRTLRKEKKILKQIILKNKIDTVISDNRFGLYNPSTQNIFITHQLFLALPKFLFFAQGINKKFISKFNEVWVPDYENEQQALSGKLSHGKQYHPNVKFIEPLSRLIKLPVQIIKYNYLVLLSGPEPQHSILGFEMLEHIKKHPNKKFALASAFFKTENTINLDCFFQPNSNELSQIIAQSETVICRSGYSTLMDMHCLQKKNLILIPTKGQMEQEYLAKYWKGKFAVGLF